MGQIIWRTIIQFTTGTLKGSATLLFDCDSINMTFGMVICLTILDPPASKIVPPQPEARREGEANEASDSSSDEDDTPLEQREWPNLEAYRQAVFEGMRYRLVASADTNELAGMRIYRTGEKVVCVFWSNPDMETWNHLKGRIFLLLVGPATVTSTNRHIAANKSDCRTLGHVYMEWELLGFCQNVVEDKWKLQLRVQRRPTMVFEKDEGSKDVEDYWGKHPGFIPATFYFPRVINVPWKQD